MKLFKSYKKRLFVFFLGCISVLLMSYIGIISAVPGKIILLEGEEYICRFKSIFLINIRADREDIVKLGGGEKNVSGDIFRVNGPLMLKTQKKGSVNLKLDIFGIIPVKTMQVDIVPNKKVVACGNTVGVKLKIDGILVIGISDVETTDGKKVLPAKESGIKTGDFIIEANGKKIPAIEDLVREVDKSGGKKMIIKCFRDNAYVDIIVIPVKSADDKKFHLGLWVRDSTAGIGTLTFYDPDTLYFGALGHGITDIDTGILMPVNEGEILESSILAIKKGQQGSPGELKGVFIEDRDKLGNIERNSEYGIYGIMDRETLNRISERTYPVAARNQIREGPATILANIDGKDVKEYDIEIQKVAKQNLSSTKCMIIRITDKRLLESTGGIVQGMSGSPIIQDGKIVGAVTHVLVNDPTRGYGIFIERMIKNLEEMERDILKKTG